MATLTQSLREENRELASQIERLRLVADSVDEVPMDYVRGAVGEICAFLSHYIVPHVVAEESTLYPMVDQILAAPEATALLSRDHVEILRLVDELAAIQSVISGRSLGEAQARALRRILYGLYTLLKVQVAKEEEIYLPMLDAWLTPGEAYTIVEAMGEADREARVCPLD